MLLTQEYVEFHGLAATAKTVNMLDRIDWLFRIDRQIDIDVEAQSTQEIRADRHQIGKKIQAEIAQIPDYQVALFNPGGQVFRKPLVAIGTLANGECSAFSFLTS